MNPEQRLGEYLRQRKGTPAEERASLDRVLEKLRSEGDQDAKEFTQEFQQPPRVITRWPMWAGAATAIVLAVAASAVFVRTLSEYAPPAVVEAIDGKRNIEFGESVRSNNATGTVVRLADGSRVEMRSESELSLERADDGVRIRLQQGGVIVNAAKQRNGHLYVQTKDVTVSVVGTVFLVNADEEGSRVAVIEGEVRVQQGTTLKKLLPGDQVSTNPLIVPMPVAEQIAWSRNAAAHLALLQQSLALLRPPTTVPPPPPPKRLEFDAASVKLEPRPSAGDGIRSTAVFCHAVDGVVGPPGLRGPQDIPQGWCVGRHVNLVSLVAIAYDMKVPNPRLRVSGGADWVTDAWGSGYEIEAKAEDVANVTKEQLRQMLQSLAADRFKLKVSRVTREVDGTALVVAKGGAKLQEVSVEEPWMRSNKMSQGKIEVGITGKATMKAFAEHLSFSFPTPDKRFVDMTGLTGIYAINLFYSFAPPPPGEGGARGGGGDPGALAISELGAALQDQLGLRLEYTKVPDEFIVIEHAEKPTEN
jgi:uncharacterized protein (TIGR03435 family)